jgi:HEPN domain-containing protein
MKPGREAARRWLRRAEHDLAIARGHQQRGDFSDACFMAEQAAQKALKALLIAHGHRSVPIHSVAQLTERCAQIHPAFAVHITAGRVLDQYYIPTRYPDALAPPGHGILSRPSWTIAPSSSGHQACLPAPPYRETAACKASCRARGG